MVTRPRRGRAALIVPVAVAVVLVAGCAATPAGPPAAAPSTRQSVRAHPSADVPWAALDPTYPSIPRQKTPAFPDPAAAREAPACRADDLRASSLAEGVGGGTWMLEVSVRKRGPGGCRVAGPVRVTPLAGSGAAAVPVQAGRTGEWAHDYHGPVLVTPARAAALEILWPGGWCTRPIKVDRVRVALAQGRGAVTVPGFRGTPGCMLGPISELPARDRRKSPLVVGRFSPERWRPATVESAWAGTRAVLRRTAGARPGRPLDFEVVLTARRDVPLDPCPDFTVEQYLAHRRSREDRFALNCAAVPTRDAHGRPYLPAGRPVRFAMHVDLLAAHAVKFVWTLDVPEHVGDGRALVAAR